MHNYSHGTPYLWVKLKNFTYITGNIGSNLRLTLTIDGQKTSIEGTGENLDKTLYWTPLSGLSDLPITSTIVEEDKHEDSSTITLDKEGKTLVVPVQTKLEEIQKNLEEEGSFVPAETEQQSYAFEQFVEETRGNQYTEDATFAIILSWTALLSADWTDQERKKLKFGPKDTTSQWNQRILLERRNGLERYAWKLFEQYSYKAKAPTYNVDPFGELATENLITVINFNRFGDLLKEIASNQSFNDIDKTFLWSVIAKGLRTCPQQVQSVSKIQNIPRIRKMAIALGYANFMPVLSAILMIGQTQPFKCSGQSIVLLLAFCWLIIQVLVGLILSAGSFGSCQPMGSVKAVLLNLASIPVAQRHGGTENV